MRLFFLVTFLFNVGYSSGQTLRITRQLSNIPSSIRGLSVVNESVVWFSGSKGYVGRSFDGGISWKYGHVKEFETLDFRSLYAFDSLTALIANAGSPAQILKTTDGGKTWKPVYYNSHSEIFLDGMDFWDHKNGMIYGDPIGGRMMVLKTSNAGDSWIDVAQAQRPILENGEASFAASGTAIRCLDKKNVVIATGGVISRLWISNDNGEHWQPRPVPIVQGKNTTGIFSVGIKSNQWIVVGGDYQADSLMIRNVFYSSNGGRTWETPVMPTRGYRSGVEYISNETWIAVGQGGIDYSTDHGKNWLKGPDESGLHVVRRARNGSTIFAAGNGKVCVLKIE